MDNSHSGTSLKEQRENIDVGILCERISSALVSSQNPVIAADRKRRGHFWNGTSQAVLRFFGNTAPVLR